MMGMVGVVVMMGMMGTMIAKVKARAQSKAIAEKGGVAEAVEKGATGVIGLAVRARARARARAGATANPRRKVHQNRRNPVLVKGLAVWLKQILTTRRLGIFRDTSRVPRVQVIRPNLPILGRARVDRLLGRARVDRLLEGARVDPILVKGAGRDIHPPVPRQRR